MAERETLPTEQSIAFGARIKKLRTEKELTLDQVGAAIGVGRSMVHQYESGVSLPSIQRLAMLANYLQCTTDFLLYGKRMNHENAKNIARIAKILEGMNPEQVDAFFKFFGGPHATDEEVEEKMPITRGNKVG